MRAPAAPGLASLETMPGLACPQTAQARIFCGTQVGQTGPPGMRMLTGRRRPQRAHRSRLAGSVTRQCGQTGRPCSSRAAGSRTVPHRPQGTAFGAGAAGAADPQPVQQLAQRDVTPALRACRPLDNGAWRPQAEHVVTGSGRQPGQSCTALVPMARVLVRPDGHVAWRSAGSGAEPRADSRSSCGPRQARTQRPGMPDWTESQCSDALQPCSAEQLLIASA